LGTLRDCAFLSLGLLGCLGLGVLVAWRSCGISGCLSAYDTTFDSGARIHCDDRYGGRGMLLGGTVFLCSVARGAVVAPFSSCGFFSKHSCTDKVFESGFPSSRVLGGYCLSATTNTE
jgi:hypothetical protein